MFLMEPIFAFNDLATFNNSFGKYGSFFREIIGFIGDLRRIDCAIQIFWVQFAQLHGKLVPRIFWSGKIKSGFKWSLFIGPIDLSKVPFGIIIPQQKSVNCESPLLYSCQFYMVSRKSSLDRNVGTFFNLHTCPCKIRIR